MAGEWDGVCCYEGCEQPSEWPGKDGNVCQSHWEHECSQSWWEMVFALSAAGMVEEDADDDRCRA